ncbi:MAG: VanZ family protein [Verrucomicrobiales bacterium]
MIPWMQRPRVWFGAYAGWLAVLFVLSSLPGSGLEFHPFGGFDKIEHAGYFLVGSLILGLGLSTRGDWPRRWWWLPLAASGAGAFDEWHQQFSPGRSGLSGGDWLADVGGGFAGIFAVGLIRRRWRAIRPPVPDF